MNKKPGDPLFLYKGDPNMTVQKFLSALLCAALLLCVAGCKQEPAPATLPVNNTPEPAGVLFVSIGAEFKVIYDTDGLVIAVDSITDTAADVIISLEEIYGVPCDQLVSQLVKETISAGKHPYNRVVVIKQAPGSAPISSTFLEDVRIDAAAVTDYEVVLIPAENLTDKGYITGEAAVDILTRQLKLTDVTMSCVDNTAGAYVLTFELEGAEQEYQIDAVTGTVFLDSLPSDLMGPNEDIFQEDFYGDEVEYDNPGPMDQ